MRWAILLAAPAVLVAGMLVFGACGEDQTSTEPPCQSTLVPAPCFDCVKSSCCQPPTDCVHDAQCYDCLGGNKASCSSPKWGTLYQCGDAACHDKCAALQLLHADCTAPDTSVSGGTCVTVNG